MRRAFKIISCFLLIIVIIGCRSRKVIKHEKINTKTFNELSLDTSTITTKTQLNSLRIEITPQNDSVEVVVLNQKIKGAKKIVVENKKESEKKVENKRILKETKQKETKKEKTKDKKTKNFFDLLFFIFLFAIFAVVFRKYSR